MTYRPSGRLKSRNSWSAILAVLLSTLAGASAFGLNGSFAGGTSIAEQNADTRSASKPASLRTDKFDPSLNLGGLADPGPGLDSSGHGLSPWTGSPRLRLPAALSLPVSVERMRDGRSRAPPPRAT